MAYFVFTLLQVCPAHQPKPAPRPARPREKTVHASPYRHRRDDCLRWLRHRVQGDGSAHKFSQHGGDLGRRPYGRRVAVPVPEFRPSPSPAARFYPGQGLPHPQDAISSSPLRAITGPSRLIRAEYVLLFLRRSGSNADLWGRVPKIAAPDPASICYAMCCSHQLYGRAETSWALDGPELTY